MFVYSPIEYVKLVVGRLLSSCCLTHQGMMKHQTAKVVRRGLLLKKFLHNKWYLGRYVLQNLVALLLKKKPKRKEERNVIRKRKKKREK